MCSKGYCIWFVCVSVCVSVALFVGQRSLYAEMEVQTASVHTEQTFIRRDYCLIRKLWRSLLTCDMLPGYCSDVLRTFSMAEPSKGPKMAKNRLNANTTRCKATSFFLYSLCLLPKIIRILPVTRN